MKTQLFWIAAFLVVSSFSFSQDYYSKSSDEFLQMPSLQKTIDPENYDKELLNATLFHMTNKYRAAKKKSVLKYSDYFTTSAYGHSSDMARKDFFSHKSPIRKKRTMLKRVELAGLKNYKYLSENIAYKSVRGMTYYELAEYFVFDSWHNSAGHRKNMLSNEIRYAGCGIAFTPSKKFGWLAYATQNFGNYL